METAPKAAGIVAAILSLVVVLFAGVVGPSTGEVPWGLLAMGVALVAPCYLLVRALWTRHPAGALGAVWLVCVVFWGYMFSFGDSSPWVLLIGALFATPTVLFVMAVLFLRPGAAALALADR